MQSYIHSGDDFPIVAPGAMTVDVPYLLGGRIVIPCATVASGETVNVKSEGTFRLPKVSTAISGTPHIAGEALTLGQRVYWDRTNSKVTGKPVGPYLGEVQTAASSSATEVRVTLRQVEESTTGVTCGWLDGNGGLATGAHDLDGGTIPAGATIKTYFYKVLRNNFASPTSDGATIALGHADSAACIKAATAISSGTTWDATGTTIMSAAAAVAQTTAERAIRATVAVEGTSNTDSVLVVWVEWIMLGSFA